MRCPGSVALSHGVGDTSSDYADEGTAAHYVAAKCLMLGLQADAYIGAVLCVWNDGSVTDCENKPANEKPRYSCTVDADFAEHVQYYVDDMRKLQGMKLYEVRVDYSAFIGVDESTGTSDTVVLNMPAERIEAHDLKFGKGIMVYASWLDEQQVAHPNEQLALYLLGALNDADILANWKEFVIGVNQPRIGGDGHKDTFTMTREQLMAFAQSARAAAAEAMSGFAVAIGKQEPMPYAVLDLAGLIRPGWKQCMFCPAGKAERCAKKYVRQPPHKGKVAADADFGAPLPGPSEEFI